MASQDQSSSNPFLAKESGAENTKPKSMDYHRQMMEKKLNRSNGYVFGLRKSKSTKERKSALSGTKMKDMA